MQRTALLASLLLLLLTSSTSITAFVTNPIGALPRLAVMTVPSSPRLPVASSVVDSDDDVVVASTITTTTTTTKTIIDAPYGAWESPITSRAITAGSVRLGPLYCLNGEAYWLEGRPMEGGRNVLCRRRRDADAAGAADVTPPGSNVRSRVHEYGGGAVVFGRDVDSMYYTDFVTQGIRRIVNVVHDNDDENGGGMGAGGGGVTSIPITPVHDGGENGDHVHRFADAVLSDDGNIMYAVREYHPNGGNTDPKDVVNELVSIDINTGEVSVIATGRDFYAHPRLSSDGTKLAYVTWDHPNMPWDATELRVVDVVVAGDNDDGSGGGHPSSASNEHVLIAGGDGNTSIIQPCWHPISGELFYLSDETGYYNIRRAGRIPDDTTTSPVLPMDYDFGGSAPGWTLGQMGYAFLDDGRLVAQYVKDGRSVLVVADVVGDECGGHATNIREYSGEVDGLPDMIGGIVTGVGTELFFLGGSPGVPSCVYGWNLDDDDYNRTSVVIARSSNVTFPDDVISRPMIVDFPTTLGTAHGYYYPPKNGGFVCTTDTAPPLLVKAHGE